MAAAALLPLGVVISTVPANAADPVYMYACQQYTCVGAQVNGHITWTTAPRR